MKQLGTRRIVALPCVVMAILLVVTTVTGCGGSGSSDASARPIPDSAPHIDVPPGLPPKKLVVKDLREGTGKEAKKGDEVEIQYYGITWGSGTEHANSWHYSHPPVFTLGSHRILRGFNLAIPGMKEGGSREVIIPSNLVYYPGDPQPHLTRLDALIYKIYLVKILGK